MTDPQTDDAGFDLARLQHCFEGAIPAVLATVSADGVPNVTYLSKIHRVDDTHVALSNQFMSKSAQNLIEHPRASVMLMDARTHDEYRLAIEYERTERRGPVFDRLRTDVDLVAASIGMENVFRLRAADIYRVVRLEHLNHGVPVECSTFDDYYGERAAPDAGALAQLTARISRCGELDVLVRIVVDGLDELLGYDHSMLLLLNEDATGLFTIASRGFASQGIGSEVRLGEGVIGQAAERCAPMRIGNLVQAEKYITSVRRAFEESGEIRPGREVPMPQLDGANSRLALPAMALGQLVGVLAVESHRRAEYTAADEAALSVVASLVASAIESIRAEERRASGSSPSSLAGAAPKVERVSRTHVRYFPVDGSTFLDGDYLIKGVAGRLLWALLGQYSREHRVEFTNREMRLDPSLDLPDFKDNFESRLILLKRRLDEREAPIRIEKTGRGLFRLDVDTVVRLEEMARPD